jgi:hypothetical protein
MLTGCLEVNFSNYKDTIAHARLFTKMNLFHQQ